MRKSGKQLNKILNPISYRKIAQVKYIIARVGGKRKAKHVAVVFSNCRSAKGTSVWRNRWSFFQQKMSFVSSAAKISVLKKTNSLHECFILALSSVILFFSSEYLAFTLLPPVKSDWSTNLSHGRLWWTRDMGIHSFICMQHKFLKTTYTQCDERMTTTNCTSESCERRTRTSKFFWVVRDTTKVFVPHRRTPYYPGNASHKNHPSGYPSISMATRTVTPVLSHKR